MIISPAILTIMGSIAALGICAGGAGFLLSQFKKGSRIERNDIVSSSTEIINFYKTENESLKTIQVEKDKAYDLKFQDLTAQIGELRGQLNSEKIQNERLEKIFQNRDPETQQFQKSMVDSMTKMAEVMSDIYTMTKAEHDRDFQVTATITKDRS